jgi:multisubunit Na+/H+ antiporter MnhC subunit
MKRIDIIFFCAIFLWTVSGIYCIFLEDGMLVYTVDLIWTAVLIAVLVAGRISKRAGRWLDKEV